MVDEVKTMEIFIGKMKDHVDYLRNKGVSKEYISAWASGYLAGASDIAEDISRMINEAVNCPSERADVFIKTMKGLSN